LSYRGCSMHSWLNADGLMISNESIGRWFGPVVARH
jgi:hypothetical protein